MMTTYSLTIYARDARTIRRQTTHATAAQARRSLARYEARHGRHCHSIDRQPLPACDDARGWDRYRCDAGI